MSEDEIMVIGDYIELSDKDTLDMSSTLRLKANSINREQLWMSKDRSAEFMGDIWSFFVEPEKAEKIKMLMHTVCVELIENSVKYGLNEIDCIITINLYLKNNAIYVYVKNRSERSQIKALEESARQILEAEDIRKLFKQKMKDAKAAKKKGIRISQLGFVRIVMENIGLAWKIETCKDEIFVTTMVKITLE